MSYFPTYAHEIKYVLTLLQQIANQAETSNGSGIRLFKPNQLFGPFGTNNIVEHNVLPIFYRNGKATVLIAPFYWSVYFSSGIFDNIYQMNYDVGKNNHAITWAKNVCIDGDSGGGGGDKMCAMLLC